MVERIICMAINRDTMVFDAFVNNYWGYYSLIYLVINISGE